MGKLSMSGTNPQPPVSSRPLFETCFGGFFLEDSVIAPGTVVSRFRHPSWGLGWLCLTNPTEIRVATSRADVHGVLEFAASGGPAALLLPYEAGKALHPFLPASEVLTAPLFAWAAKFGSVVAFYKELASPMTCPEVSILGSDFDRDEFGKAFGDVKSSLASGETYQVNLTQRLRFRHTGSAWDLFVSRCGVDPPPFATFVHGGSWQVASWSPELLLEVQGGIARAKPMKGTASRDLPSDVLRTDKTFAENLMIVDMVRNDLGSVAKIGSVHTRDLFQIESYRSVWQMTSTVSAQIESDPVELMRAVFPPASVTGAPKRAACEVIDRLERSPRGIYCGALGLLNGAEMRLSVGIRSAFLQDGEGDYGVGSGIVWDSEESAEYDEWMLKAQAFLRPAEPWRLLETTSFEALQDPVRMARHLRRLEASCRILAISYDEDAVKACIDCLEPSDESVRVRLMVDRFGVPMVESVPGRRQGSTLRWRLAKWPVSSQDPALRFKATSRQVYAEHLHANPDADEVLLFNERGDVTEFTSGALLARFGDQWCSPPDEAGCLPSVGLQSRQVVRANLTPQRILEADEVLMVNARGEWVLERLEP